MTNEVNQAYYESRLRIDRYALDTEIIEHVELFYRTSLEVVAAISIRDRAKQRIKKVDAQVAAELRDDDPKITQTAITREIDAHLLHRNAQRKYQDACTVAAEWEALRDAFRQRGFALKELVALQVDAAYSTNSGRGPEDYERLPYRSPQQERLSDARKKRGPVRNRRKLKE